MSALVDVIDDLVNPFKESQELLNISNAAVASTDIAKDLAKAKERGESAYTSFKEDRLETDPPAIQFHERLPKLKLKTFTDASKSKRIKSGSGKEIILRTTTRLFGNMLLLAQTIQFDMKVVLEHALGPLPWSLATADGLPRTTSKSALANELKKNISSAEDIPTHSVCLIDGMSLVHKVKGEHKTFGDIASLILAKTLNEASHSCRLDIVFYVYKEKSIKNVEREIRGSNVGAIQLKKSPPSKQLSNGENFFRQHETRPASFISWCKNGNKRSTLKDKMAKFCM